MYIIETIAQILYGCLALYGASNILFLLKTPEKIMKYVKILLFWIVTYATLAFVKAKSNPFLWDESERGAMIFCWLLIAIAFHIKWIKINDDNDEGDLFLGI